MKEKVFESSPLCLEWRISDQSAPITTGHQPAYSHTGCLTYHNISLKVSAPSKAEPCDSAETTSVGRWVSASTFTNARDISWTSTGMLKLYVGSNLWHVMGEESENIQVIQHFCHNQKEFTFLSEENKLLLCAYISTHLAANPLAQWFYSSPS